MTVLENNLTTFGTTKIAAKPQSTVLASNAYPSTKFRGKTNLKMKNKIK
jgi:hypothetical protein